MTDTTSKFIDDKTGQKINHKFKRPYRIADKIIIVLDESLIKKLEIDEEHVWFEQIATENGILLKITNCLI